MDQPTHLEHDSKVLYMKNLITENYIIWLNKYKTAYPKDPESELSAEIISNIKNAETLDQLISLFTDISKQVPDESGHVYGSINFYAQITGWNKHLEIIKSEFPATITLLKQMLTGLEVNTDQRDDLEQSIDIDAIDKTKTSASLQKSASLIRFLMEVINAPKASLHIRIHSLLLKISHPDFSRLVTFLANLDEAPYPTNPRRGEFAEIPPHSYAHRICLHMLYNLAAIFNSSDPLCDLGNGLLQESILIDKDLHSEEISLDEDIPPEPNQGSCTLI